MTLTKILSGLVLVLLALCLFLSISLKYSKQENEQLKADIVSAQEVNDSLVKQVEKQAKEKEDTDALIADYQRKQALLSHKTCQIVKAISTLPPKANNEEIDIDSKLPPSIVWMLKQSYDSLQRQGSSDAYEPSNQPM